MFGETSHKILHRARSMRRLRGDLPKSSHFRQPSDTSDLSRASSSGSDTTTATSTGSRRDMGSVEWDPLRLHPSMDVDRSPFITPERRYHHQEVARHTYHHAERERQQHHLDLLPRASQQPPAPEDYFALEIHEGFDFGFDASTPKASAMAAQQRRHQLRQPKSQPDLRKQQHRRTEIFGAPMRQWSDGGGDSGDSTLLPSPTRRPHPAGLNEVDAFIKRGGWKRRGIVFGTSEEKMASEDDCFEI